MKTPEFWYTRRLTWPAALLLPFAGLYGLILWIRSVLYRRAAPLPVPVIAVGNLTAGGNGKTPTALALLSLIHSLSPQKRVFFLSRGTGAKLRGPVRVDPLGSAADYGDEPLLLARHAPTIIARDRRAGALLAIREGAEVIIMDDGLQNRRIAPDIRLIVIDTARGFGNSLLIPAGPLRQCPGPALRRADAVLLVRDSPPPPLPPNIPVLRGRRAAVNPPDTTRPYIAFAGLAAPDQFFGMLRDLGLNILATHAFPDHHAYTALDLAALAQEAAAQNATLITTEKDAVKLPSSFAVTTLPIQMQITPLTPLVDILKNKGGII